MKINNPINLNSSDLKIPIRNNKELVFWRDKVLKIYPNIIMTAVVENGILNECSLLSGDIYLVKNRKTLFIK